jgi:hypothetical protein
MKQMYEEALAQHDECLALMEESAGLTLRDREEFVPRGIYRHFKGTAEDPKHYLVYGIGQDVDGGPYRVSYEALYPPHAGEIAYRMLAGTDDAFLMPIDRREYRGPRFVLVRKAMTLTELETLAREYLHPALTT